MNEEQGPGVVERLYLECERARAQGDLITRVSASDKEFHFQNWIKLRLDGCGFDYDEPGRNTYPDFRLVRSPVGFEVKGLAWPGREADYDSNSQVPTGLHHGREVYYIFGRYPTSVADVNEYPVTDLVVCHGSFLNSDIDYLHVNKSFRGFGSYGDILVRDRKMYVVPTPFALLDGTSGLSTLIMPEDQRPVSAGLEHVGEIERAEVSQIVTSYEFNLENGRMTTHVKPNTHAGRAHKFSAYRTRGQGHEKLVTLSARAIEYSETMRNCHD